ncbi:MAG TPA: peroxiredoxin [Pyrinomonadaceae bacterium]|nr:peroxiredoxin [Pyrinomonadaceae bacterium]
MLKRMLSPVALVRCALATLALALVVAAQQPSPSTEKAKTDAAHYAAASATKATAAAPKVGEAAPDFKLPYATQEKVFMKPDEQMSLSSLRGKNVILAFYPADWSGGCTTEVCTFRDTFADLGKLNAVVLGISGDYVFSHHEWAKHHKLQFPLLSDHDHKVARLYDSYMEQYGMNKRTIFLIDKEGIVRYVNLALKANEKKDYDALRAELEKLK